MRDEIIDEDPSHATDEDYASLFSFDEDDESKGDTWGGEEIITLDFGDEDENDEKQDEGNGKENVEEV